MLELFTTDWKEIWGETDREFSLGSIYTRPEIVELILDLSGYDALNHRLISYRTLEPSCGNGAFVTAIVHRLILSELHWSKTIDWYDPLWDQTLLASDIDLETIAQLRRTITALLIEAGCPTNRSHELSQQWTVQTDFLLHDWQGCFHFILGNPPYVRIEDLPKPVLHRYREQYRTATDRADIYVPFIERSLQLLAPNGTLGIICTNRFTKNKYGKRLRELISASHHVKWYINLEHTQPFEQNVSAYPAIFVLDNAKGEETQATTLTDLSPETLQAVRLKGSDSQELISTFPSWYRNGTPWISTSHKRLTLLQKLEEHFPTLAETPSEITIGIGVATGADKVFILPKKREDIESEHQLPLLMSSHVGESELCWEGEYLINPFADEKTTELVDLEKSAGLRNYLYQHEQRLRQRYIAQASPENWYRTIDRVWPSLVKEPKLVIPDIQSGNVVGYDRGEFYPHHNLYWITSSTWNLRALQAIMRSNFVRLQVEAYSVQMRGGSLRYQAQTLRLIRIPTLATLRESDIEEFASLASCESVQPIDDLLHQVLDREGINLEKSF